ncbi:MAG: hypothetical protein HYU04_00335 [Candidatus Wildermuthbacteria bacterium]|nr:hypothetical protein [Candidatus Wildermuthbacteria bacterium]
MAEIETLEEQEEETPEEQDSTQEQEAVEKSRVHPLAPDFLLILFAFAMPMDALDAILEITGIFVIPKILGMALDAFTFIVISWWVYSKVKRIVQTREQMKKGAVQKLQRGQQKLQQQLARAAQRGPLRKVLLRGGIALLGELIPFVGLIPFWSITVFSTLREK